MKILILSLRQTRDSQVISAVAAAVGYTCIRFSTGQLPSLIAATVLKVYCEGFLAEFVSQNSSLVLLRPLEEALAEAPAWVTGRSIRRMTAADLSGVAFPCFVKPVDQKFFQAQVYHSIEALAPHIARFPADAVYVSEIVNFRDEYRHFVLDGAVIASSPYELGGRYVGDDAGLPPVPPEIIAFAERVVAACAKNLPPACVVDIGVTDAGVMCLIEFNPVWASGIYGADPAACLRAIEGGSIDRKDLTERLKRFETFDCSQKD